MCLRKISNECNIQIEDLAVPLMIYFDPSIQIKQISFSLDPKDKNNPSGPLQEKVYWPDNYYNRRIVGDTKFGDILYETDFIMK